jgi:hypothetical protein
MEAPLQFHDRTGQRGTIGASREGGRIRIQPAQRLETVRFPFSIEEIHHMENGQPDVRIRIADIRCPIVRRALITLDQCSMNSFSLVTSGLLGGGPKGHELAQLVLQSLRSSHE